MASKRRNMFYENKKQETTKIAILFEYTGSLKMFSESQLDFSTGAAGFWRNKTSSQEDRQLKDVGMSYERFTEGLLKSMVRLRLNGADSIRFGYVIDGYPKTADQAAMLFANPNASIVNTFGPPMPQEINMAGDHGDNFETAVAPANPLSNIGPSRVGLVIVACNEGGGVSPLESRWSVVERPDDKVDLAIYAGSREYSLDLYEPGDRVGSPEGWETRQDAEPGQQRCWEGGWRRLRRCSPRLDEANLKINIAMCHFAVKEVNYLGQRVTGDGVKLDPEKIRADNEYPQPKSAKDVRSFLGLAGYYRRFVAHFAEIAKPLTLPTRNKAAFQWGEIEDRAFKQLKKALCSDHVLINPDFSHSFILATGASGTAIGAVLSQLRNGAERPIAFASRQLNQAEVHYSATERELLATVWATQQFRCYLLGRKFTLITDHGALRWMLSLRDP
ncbi:hypothetical protein AAG570_008287 [Ranatra chinensis]|uniref:RNA-directed DNA polymerase n=1 Tax=Ranatra chinensis TaxID=642074 RepID=A0ABD0YGL6_9HEMI